MFLLLLMNLRSQGVKVGLGEWRVFLEGLEQGLAFDLDSLYRFGRAVLCHTEAHFDAWDIAFKATFDGVELPSDLKDRLAEWLTDARSFEGEKAPMDLEAEELRRLFLERLREQKERHDGGNRWIGSGGTSPFGSGGGAESGIRVGEGGGRSAISVAGDRRWQDYRKDRVIDVRDMAVALRALRDLAREGPMALEVDKTVKRTADNAGDIDLVFERERKNRVHLVLLMDTGGTMSPHTRLVEQLFSAAQASKGFKSFQALFFHNVPYGWLYKNYATWDRVPIPELMRGWTPAHRLIWVGDASMAPYELHSSSRVAWVKEGPGMSGMDWLLTIRRQCPASVWLNPDPERWWDHPTVRAIGNIYPMFPLTMPGLRDAIKGLRLAG